MPSASAAAMRPFQTAGSPSLGALPAITARSMRAGAWASSQSPTAPPMERPQKCARSMASSSRIATTSRPSRSSVTGPSPRPLPPWPRVS